MPGSGAGIWGANLAFGMPLFVLGSGAGIWGTNSAFEMPLFVPMSTAGVWGSHSGVSNPSFTVSFFPAAKNGDLYPQTQRPQ
ncbi:uncharacterized protein DS421_16g549030 [Arachis hypogaea]|nr:uncharacterized protein DS421_16g549030 [Arachis hypogaea]